MSDDLLDNSYLDVDKFENKHGVGSLMAAVAAVLLRKHLKQNVVEIRLRDIYELARGELYWGSLKRGYLTIGTDKDLISKDRSLKVTRLSIDEHVTRRVES